jgi:hypothetical protein
MEGGFFLSEEPSCVKEGDFFQIRVIWKGGELRDFVPDMNMKKNGFGRTKFIVIYVNSVISLCWFTIL